MSSASLRVFWKGVGLLAVLTSFACGGDGGGGPSNQTTYAIGLAKTGGDAQSDAPGAVLAPLEVELTETTYVDGSATAIDALADTAIVWTVLGGGGTLVPTSTLTNAAGAASTQWTLGAAVGMQQARAEFFDEANQLEASVTFTATAVAPPNPCAGAGGTSHTGVIATSETWSAAGSPHRVAEGTKFDGEVVLTISPGAVVCFAHFARLDFENGAELDARGTAGQPILLTREDPALQWIGISFFNGPLNGLTQLDHVTLEGALQGLETYGDPIRIEHSLFRNNENYALFLRGTSVVLTSTIEATGAQGAGVGTAAVNLQPDYYGPGTGETARFESRVRTSDGSGLIVSGETLLTNCEVTGNGGLGAYGGVLSGIPGGVTIVGCNIFNNAGLGVTNSTPGLGTITAQGNWWGDPAGPAGPSGDGVSGGVDASGPLAAAVILAY